MRILIAWLLLSAGCFGGASNEAQSEEDEPMEASTPFNHIPAPAISIPAPGELPAGPNSTIGSPKVNLPDPLHMGAFSVADRDVDLGILVAQDSSLGAPPVVYSYPVQVTGHVYYPTDAPAEAPVIVFMHGRHATCNVSGAELIFTHVCPETPATGPIPSYRGYDLASERLASNGYVVVSLNVNQINDRDLMGDSGMEARGETAMFALDALQNIHDGTAGIANDVPELRGKLDMNRIGLMGHSRGGEGVVEATIQNQARSEPYNIKAVFTIAPTDFGRLIPEANFATLLPYCDGDVRNLHGAWMYDNSQAQAANYWLHQVLSMGSNHNFFNTVWTGDDWGTSGGHCNTDARDEAADQSTIGAGLVAAFMRNYVGDEALFSPYWSGHAEWPSWCAGSCGERLHLSTRAPLAKQTVISASGSTGDWDSTCSGNDCPWGPVYTEATATVVAWAGNTTLSYSAGGDGMDTVAFRVGLEHNIKQGDAMVVLKFSDESVVLEPTAAWFTPPGTTDAKTTLNQVRYSMDLTGLTAVELQLSGGGRLIISDVAVMNLVP